MARGSDTFKHSPINSTSISFGKREPSCQSESGPYILRQARTGHTIPPCSRAFEIDEADYPKSEIFPVWSNISGGGECKYMLALYLYPVCLPPAHAVDDGYACLISVIFEKRATQHFCWFSYTGRKNISKHDGGTAWVGAYQVRSTVVKPSAQDKRV